MVNFDRPAPEKYKDFEAIPTGEVTEGNEDSDWAAWEDSVAFQDSMMPGFQGSVSLSQSMDIASDPATAASSESSPVSALEVIEGDDESAWAAWEESVQFHESQFQNFQATALAPETLSGEATTEHVDIFSASPQGGA